MSLTAGMLSEMMLSRDRALSGMLCHKELARPETQCEKTMKEEETLLA